MFPFAGRVRSRRRNQVDWLFPALMPVILLMVGFLVLRANAQNVINTIAGGGKINPNPFLAAIPGPTGVAEDANGNLYVIAPPVQQVFELSGGKASNFAGAGYYSYHPSGGSWNGPPLTEPMADPFGITVDTQGNIYIADTNNFVIRVVNTQANQITVAGVVIPPGYMVTVAGDHSICHNKWCGDKGPALKAELNGAQGVAVDASGNIYLADSAYSGDRVRCVLNVLGGCGDKKQKYQVGDIINYAGNLYYCGQAGTNPPSCGDYGPAKSAYLNGPMGIALDGSGNLYIADTFDNRIRCVLGPVPGGCGDSQNKYKVGWIIPIAGTGTGGNSGDGGPATEAELNLPRGVSVDGSGNFYIADTRNNRIRCVLGVAGGCGDQTDPVGTIIRFAGGGIFGFSGDGGLATKAELEGPNGVLVDKSGNVFVADTSNQRIRKVTGGVINTIMGGGNGGDNGPATAATLANPYAVALDSSNNYYIADSGDNRVRVVNTSQENILNVAGVQVQPGNIATVAGNGDVGHTGDTGPATLATLDSPLGVAVDTSGNIFIADTYNNEVRCVLNVIGGCGDSQQNYSVGSIITFAGQAGQNCSGMNICGDGGPATQAQLTPSTPAVDSSGNVYIADASGGTNRIRCVLGVAGGCGDPTDPVGTIITVAGTGDAGYSGDGGPATQAELSHPFGIALDASDNLYIADADNNRVRCVLGVIGGCGDSADEYPVGTIVTYVYTGGEGYCCHQNDLWRLNASRWAASTVAVDSYGNLFIGGGQYHLVQRVDWATGYIYTVAGNDRRLAWGLYGDGGPATMAELDNIGQAIDSDENLLIADARNNRIRAVLSLVPVVTFSPKSLNFGNEPVGQTSQPLTVTLQNTGADDLLISSITVSGDFAMSNTTCPINSGAVAPTSSCTISVTFTPTKKGTRTGHITVTDNGYKSPQQVKLTGVGE